MAPFAIWELEHHIFSECPFCLFLCSVKSSDEKLITNPAEPVGCRLPRCSAVSLLMNEFLGLRQVSRAPVTVPVQLRLLIA